MIEIEVEAAKEVVVGTAPSATEGGTGEEIADEEGKTTRTKEDTANGSVGATGVESEIQQLESMVETTAVGVPRSMKKTCRHHRRCRTGQGKKTIRTLESQNRRTKLRSSSSQISVCRVNWPKRPTR